ncbi:MAG: hypothetical protein WCV67_20030 [Victivallaceae bacterium]
MINCCVQRHSKRAVARFILLAQGCPECADVVSRMFNCYAQRHSKRAVARFVMPAAWAGREGVSKMGENLKGIMLNDTPKCRNTSPTSDRHSAQRHSKVSESGGQNRQNGEKTNGADGAYGSYGANGGKNGKNGKNGRAIAGNGNIRNSRITKNIMLNDTPNGRLPGLFCWRRAVQNVRVAVQNV